MTDATAAPFAPATPSVSDISGFLDSDVTPAGAVTEPVPAMPAEAAAAGWARVRPADFAASQSTVSQPAPWDLVPMAPGPDVSPVVAAGPAADAVATDRQPDPDPAPVVVDVPARPFRRQAGDTAPDFLMRAPPSVSSTADAFFDGLVRRVESDR